jgi:hypothetical protein
MAIGQQSVRSENSAHSSSEVCRIHATLNFGEEVLKRLRDSFDKRHGEELEKAWREDRAKQWTAWILGKKGKPGDLAKIAREIGYEEVEYEWFRADQYWYHGMIRPDRWDWNDSCSVAVEHANSPRRVPILYDIRKLCNITVPVKLFVGYRTQPQELLPEVENLIKRRERLLGSHYILIFGWWKQQLEWQGYSGVFHGEDFKLKRLCHCESLQWNLSKTAVTP